MYVCICTGITDRQIKQAIKEGAHSLTALGQELGIALQCGECACLTQEILSETLGLAHTDEMSETMSDMLTATNCTSAQDTTQKSPTPLFYEAT